MNTSLLEALGIQDLSPEEQEEMLIELNDLVFKGSLIRIVELMDDETKDKFNDLLEADPPEEEIQAFFLEHVPGADKAIEETIEEIRDDILAVTSASSD